MKKSVFLFLISFCMFMGTSVFANEDGVKVFLDKVAMEFERIDKIHDNTEKKKEVKKISNEIMDLPWIGKFVLGKHRRTLTIEQIDHFIDLYSQYMIVTYFEILFAMKKDAYTVVSVENQKDNIYLAETLIKFDGRDTDNVFRIIKTEDGYLITDIITEGISFISIQRADVMSRIDSFGFDEFMKEIKDSLGDKDV
ncbi:MAG: ABC transporter substrate-binding protein [Rickettsiales bacterium]|nr:ABC transporter substrate-binding protein [Rickettsiales bacterium]